MTPNILLIVFDTARADAFEPYGAAPGASPTLADLAIAGTASPDTRSTACWTVPAHLSLFSGLLPRAAGFVPAPSATGYRPLVRGQADDLLPAVLARAGYETIGLSTNGLVSPWTGFDAGFEEFEFIRGWRTKKLSAESLRTRVAWYQEGFRARLDDGAAQLERRLDSRLKSRSSRPFFWFVNLVECHSPYLPPRPYNDLSAPDRLRAAREARRYLSFSSIWKCSTGGFDVPPDALERMRHLYTAAVRQLDDWLGRVLEALDRRGVLQETQVVVTSDHGENLGDGEMLGHAFSLDDRLLRVPLVTAGPAALPAGGIRSLRAVPAWLANVAQLGDHPFGTRDIEGVSVAEFDAALRPEDPRIVAAMDAWATPLEQREHVSRRLTTSFTCATDGQAKLVRRLDREELFDLTQDPLEEHPKVVESHDCGGVDAERLRRLRTALDRADAENRRTQSDAADDDEAVPPDEAAQLEAQMRLLGYL